jgi:predicted ATP-grasp superfamily ATP-dependent carboligase
MKNFKNKNLILSSFSIRAAAECFSTLKNQNIYCFDFFGDLDLKKIADYSFSLKENNISFKTEKLYEAVKKFLIQNKNQDYYLIYGSDWDNHPELLYKLEQFKNLKIRGNSAAVISELNKKESLKDLFKIAEKFGFKTPELFLDQKIAIEFLSKEKKNLIFKPYHSGGGLEIQIIKEIENKEKNFEDILTKKKDDFYFEEFIEGENRSCQFAADGENAEIMAFTRELKTAEINPNLENSFKYAGNILIKEEEKKIKIIKRFIQNITRKYSLQGINGIDYIKNDKGIFFIELNPRFTAAVELLIPFYQEEFLKIYLKNEVANDYLKKYLQKDFAFSTKLIYYAEQNFKLKHDLRKVFKRIKNKKIANNFIDSKIEIKDLPIKGEKFNKDDPVFTLIIKTKNKHFYLEIKNLLFSEFGKYFKEQS